MPLPVNSIIEATFRGRMFNQTILNIFHYRVALASTIVDPVAEVADFLAAFANPGAGFLRSKFLACLPETYELIESRGQAIHPIRYRVVIQGSGGAVPGGRDPVETANLASVLTLQSVLAGRREVGSKHLVTGGATDVAGGRITAGLTTALTAFRTELLNQLVGTIGGGVYQPVIYHRGAVVPKFSDLDAVVIQDTVRVMRRRTVGLGI